MRRSVGLKESDLAGQPRCAAAARDAEARGGLIRVCARMCLLHVPVACAVGVCGIALGSHWRTCTCAPACMCCGRAVSAPPRLRRQARTAWEAQGAALRAEAAAKDATSGGLWEPIGLQSLGEMKLDRPGLVALAFVLRGSV